MKKQIEQLILSMVEEKFQAAKFTESFYTDIKDIVSTIEDTARYVEDGVYNMTDEEVRAESESFNPKV